MKKINFIGLLLLGYFLVSAQTETTKIAIINATIIEVEQGQLKQNQTILIEDGLIKDIRKNRKKKPKGAKVIDAKGKFIVPGLVDAHIHFFQSGGLYTRPDAIDLRKYVPYEEEIAWLKKEAGTIAKRYLQAGITTIVDVGGPMHNYTIREALKEDKSSPSIYLTGPLVSTYQPEEFQINDPPIVKVNNPAEARALVQKQIPLKPDFIKIWYIARKPQDALDTYPIIEATIQEAKKNGLRVAVHATQLYTAKMAIKAGANLLVHSVDNSSIDQEFIDLLKANDVVYCPTLIVSANYTKVLTQSYQPTSEDYQYGPPKPLGSLMDIRHLPEPDLKNRYLDLADLLKRRDEKADDIMAENLMKLINADIPIATGTDAGNIGTMHVSSYFEELRWMKKAGMSNAQILAASTINGAKAVGKSAEFGSITVGKRADLLILNQNPLEDIAHLKDIEVVMNKGTIIEKTLVLNSPAQLVQQQLNAYNGHNLEAFLAPYAADVKVYTFPNTLNFEGKEIMREQYQFIEQNPDLHCELVNRMVEGNTIIDHEKVTIDKNRPPFKAIAIYKIKDGKIAEVYFIQ